MAIGEALLLRGESEVVEASSGGEGESTGIGELACPGPTAGAAVAAAAAASPELLLSAGEVATRSETVDCGVPTDDASPSGDVGGDIVTPLARVGERWTRVGEEPTEVGEARLESSVAVAVGVPNSPAGVPLPGTVVEAAGELAPTGVDAGPVARALSAVAASAASRRRRRVSPTPLLLLHAVPSIRTGLPPLAPSASCPTGAWR